MNLFTLITTIFVISSILSYIAGRWMKLPAVISVMLLSIILAIFTIVTSKIFPSIYEFALDISSSMDFSNTLLDVLLGFLLFASALHFDLQKLKENLGGIAIISTVGVLLSALIFGGLFFLILRVLHFEIPLIYCFLFGTLVAPTDAVAVAALLKKSRMPKRLETIITGESLFNDGIGIVLFLTFLQLTENPGGHFSLSWTAGLFIREVFGGLALGAALGWLGYRLMRSAMDFQTIILISITLVMTITTIALSLHLSVPLAVVAAGLLVGSRSFSKNPDINAQDYLGRIWGLFDALLNTVLFVMIGFQMILIPISTQLIYVGALSILLLLLARAVSIILPIILLKRSMKLKYNNIIILTWGGLRGGISIALALSIPDSPYRQVIVCASFFIVVFSVVVQGLTLNKVVNRLLN